MRHWTSDLHLGHANIIEFAERPFEDVDHMNAEMIRRWNTVVRPYDEAWIVGDAVMGRIDDTLPLLGELNGDITLILGNHDRPWRGASYKPEKLQYWRDRYSEYVTVVDGPVETTIGNHDVVVNHFPYVEIARHGDKYSAWRTEPDGRWLIHGHTHVKERVDRPNKQIHVGVDAWDYTPIPDEWIEALINGQT